jgi:hypothetical protein
VIKLMQAPSASELLAVWERARAQPVTTQALMLLEAAEPDSRGEELSRLSVGRRDGRLLALREALFGARLVGLTACPQCGQQLELSIHTSELRASQLRTTAQHDVPETLSLRNGGYEATFRLPNSEDLAALTERDVPHDEQDAIRDLLSRCLVELRRNGRRQKPNALRAMPLELIEAIAAEMEKADPQANVQLNLRCANCGHQWESPFDIVSFLWSEIDNWARRMLHEVCVLASAFSWREADILAMSTQRRRVYIQMIGETA